ncbi:MAG TPA: sigma-70 family RNA polymerase sigma factor [bacterium]|nr:sigma-70 family RNA polymerase sigma factor [bacterium]
MPRPHPPDITGILTGLDDGPVPAEAGEALFEAVYEELRRIARRLMNGQRPDHTLQPTALVHEAYLKLADSRRVPWQGRAHFMRVAARAMRQILINHARDRSALKRGGAWQRVTLDEDVAGRPDRNLELLELDDALQRLASRDARMAQVVELKVFAGMKVREVAHVLGVSPRTVDNDWKVARLWLTDEMKRGGD